MSQELKIGKNVIIQTNQHEPEFGYTNHRGKITHISATTVQIKFDVPRQRWSSFGYFDVDYLNIQFIHIISIVVVE